LIKLIDSPTSTDKEHLTPDPFPNGKGLLTPYSSRPEGSGRRYVLFQLSRAHSGSSLSFSLVDSPTSADQDHLSPDPFPNGKGRLTPCSRRPEGSGRRYVLFQLSRVHSGASLPFLLVDSPTSADQDHLSPDPFPNGKLFLAPFSLRSEREGLGMREVLFQFVFFQKETWTIRLFLIVSDSF
jgi:hypothetical protein